MSDWGWVTFAYSVVYGAILAYAIYLTGRLRTAIRRRADID